MSARVDAVASRVQGALTTRKVSLQHSVLKITNCQISVLFDLLEISLLHLLSYILCEYKYKY